MLNVQPSNATRLNHKLTSMHRWLKIACMLVADIIALPFCFLAAMLLRTGSADAALAYGIAPHLMIALITIAIFTVTGLYRAVIRFIDYRLFQSAGIGLGMVVLSVYSFSFVTKFQEFLPRSAVMIYWFIAFSYIVTSRLMVRAFLREHNGKRSPAKNLVAIYGAGEAGAQLAQAMRVGGKYCARCFFDDKQALNNQNVAGLKVFHSSRLAEITKQQNIELIILAIPSATAQRRKQVMEMVREIGLPVKTMYSLIELADEKTSTEELIREIKLDDLLGRPSVPPQSDLFAQCVQHKNVLVTGAGGSIGSELCRQIMELMPTQLHLLDHSEYALYVIKQELQAHFPTMSIHAHLGSVCDTQLVERIMQQGSIHTIYHAAAYKHVPLVEANMAEGIRNNVIGAQVVADAAKKFQVQTCVLISTDKAVRPSNIMGASKRVAELIFQAAANQPDTTTTFCMVRFGNVLGSSGSVVPLFQKQIEQGGPITVTHPNVVRFFMLIPEAAQLVIQAGSMAKGGDVFVLDMGEQIKIVDLARTMINMSGLSEKNEENPDGDIEIQFVGLRPGEKLFEELLIGDEATPSNHPRIMCIKEHSFEQRELNYLIGNLMSACDANDDDFIKMAMKNIVVEYTQQRHNETPIQDCATSNKLLISNIVNTDLV